MKTLTLAVTALAASALGAGAASAEIVRIGVENFNDTAGLIDFENPSRPVNPIYTVGGLEVRFDGWFNGQSRTLACPDAAGLGCVSSDPLSPLTLNTVASDTSVYQERNFNSNVLGGSPSGASPGTGPISILFSVDQLAVGFDAGVFDTVGSTLISAFDRDGQLLGTITNEGLGLEFLGFATMDGIARIAGVQLSLIGDEPAGFAIDNLRFGTTGQVEVPGPAAGAVPEPASWAMMIVGFGLAGVGMRREARLRRRRAELGQARKA